MLSVVVGRRWPGRVYAEEEVFKLQEVHRKGGPD